MKYLCTKKIVLLSIVAVAMSCALLITVASLFTGFINAVETSASETAGDIVISIRSPLKISRYDEFIEDLQQTGSVEAASGVLSGQGLLLLGKGKVRAVKIWGIDLAAQVKVTPFADLLVAQGNGSRQVSFAPDDSAEAIGGFVGIGVVAKPDDVTDEYDFDQVKTNIGRKVRLTSGSARTESAADTEQTKIKRTTIRFTITDVVFSGIYDFDNEFIYLPIKTLTEKLYPDRAAIADMIQIKLAEDADPQIGLAVVRGVWEDFARKKLGWNNYLISLAEIETAQSMQYQLVAEYRKQMGMLMMIFGVVSGGVVLLIFCIFYLIVITKQKDIAIMKSCGSGSGSVAALFLTFGLTVGIGGSAIGVITGYCITRNVNHLEHWISVLFGLKLWKSSTYMFSKIPNQVDWHSVIWIVIAAVCAACIGSLIPAIAAARVRPVKILRYE